MHFLFFYFFFSFLFFFPSFCSTSYFTQKYLSTHSHLSRSSMTTPTLRQTWHHAPCYDPPQLQTPALLICHPLFPAPQIHPHPHQNVLDRYRTHQCSPVYHLAWAPGTTRARIQQKAGVAKPKHRLPLPPFTLSITFQVRHQWYLSQWWSWYWIGLQCAVPIQWLSVRRGGGHQRASCYWWNTIFATSCTIFVFHRQASSIQCPSPLHMQIANVLRCSPFLSPSFHGLMTCRPFPETYVAITIIVADLMSPRSLSCWDWMGVLHFPHLNHHLANVCCV